MKDDEVKNSTDDVLEIHKAKKNFRIELALIFILGLLLGITLKTEAVKRITIGFNDYKINAAADPYSASKIQEIIEQEQVSE